MNLDCWEEQEEEEEEGKKMHPQAEILLFQLQGQCVFYFVFLKDRQLCD